MEDLVGVGVADAGEETRIRQRALQRVVLPCQRLAESRQVRVEDLDAAAVELREARAPLDEVERRPLLRAHLGQHERAFRKIERRDRGAASDLRAALSPVEPAGHHQVEDEEETALQLEDDAFSEPPEAQHATSLGARQRRRDGAQEKRAAEPDRLEPLPDDARLERREIGEDVRQLRHAPEAYNSPRAR